MARILIDMDGVTVHLLPAWLARYRELSPSGSSLTPDEILDYDIVKHIPSDEAGILMGVLNEPNFFETLPPMPGAIDGINRLHEMGHEIRFLTIAYSPEAARGKCAWIEREFSGLGYGMMNMILAHEKHLIRGDVIIDDKPAVLKSCFFENTYTIGFPHPYNRNQEARFETLCDYWPEPGIDDPEKTWAKIVDWIGVDEPDGWSS